MLGGSCGFPNVQNTCIWLPKRQGLLFLSCAVQGQLWQLSIKGQQETASIIELLKMKKKSGASSTSVRTYRLCVLGPSFVGKTQLINRFVNNSFSPYYDPTLHANIYKRAFPLNDNGEEGGSQQNGEQYVKIELIDCFPHDHPALEGDTSDITPGGGDASDDLTQEMSTTLNAIVKNNLEGKFGLPPGIGTSILGKIHGYVYVYDASNKNTFETLTCLIDTVREIEKSERRGKKVVVYSPKKLVLGNKRDLIQVATAQQNRIEKSQLQKLEINKHRTVSAMTNHGVMEAFRALINEIHSCSILYKEFHDEERKRGKEAAIDEFATGAQGQDGRSSILGGSKKSNHTRGGPLQQQGGGGLLNMLPFFNCYAARDDIHLEDQEEEYEEEDVQIEGKDGEDDTTSTGGRQQRRDAENGNGGCNIV